MAHSTELFEICDIFETFENLKNFKMLDILESSVYSRTLQRARLAQSAERKALNLVVVGSSPTVGDLLALRQTIR